MDLLAAGLAVAAGVAINIGLELAPWVARSVAHFSAALLAAGHPDSRAIYEQEFAAVVNERPGRLGKLVTALGLLAAGLAQAARRPFTAGDERPRGGVKQHHAPSNLLAAQILVFVAIAVVVNVAAAPAEDDRYLIWLSVPIAIAFAWIVEWTSRARQSQATDGVLAHMKADAQTALEDFAPGLGGMKVRNAAGGSGDAVAPLPKLLAEASDPRRFVVVGDAGTGKSAVLHDLAYHLLQS
ncbi:MAG TPA: hypothetical protein VGB74_14620, partial [Actinoplanes sp.]